MLDAGFPAEFASKISSLYNKVRGRIGHGKYDLLSHITTDNRFNAELGARVCLRYFLSQYSSK